MPRKSSSGNRSKGSGQRQLHTKVKTARGRKNSSTRWLQRQLNDPYVSMAKRDGYRSRAAYKLLEMNDRHHFLKRGQKVVDLGAAPGGWTQVASNLVKAHQKDGGHVVAVDILPMDAMPQATVMQQDFMTDEAPDRIKQAIGGEADVVLSDMAPSFTGHPATDHLRTMALVEAAYALAEQILTPEGIFLAKIIQGRDEQVFVRQLKKDFRKVLYMKPPASRDDSAEHYVIAMGFRKKI